MVLGNTRINNVSIPKAKNPDSCAKTGANQVAADLDTGGTLEATVNAGLQYRSVKQTRALRPLNRFGPAGQAGQFQNEIAPEIRSPIWKI
jgi:hypothetical protein